MTCEELKEKIESGEKPGSFLVLVYPKANGSFLANQYLNAIIGMQNIRVMHINNLSLALHDSLGLQDNVLYVYRTEDFELPSKFDPEDYDNVVVICGKCKGKSDCIVRLPELTPDNIKEYMECQCPGLPLNAINWIYDEAAGSIDRIANEMAKLSLFPEDKQEEMFREAKESGNFSTVTGISLGAAVDGILSMEKKLDTLAFLNNLSETDPKGTASGGFTAFLTNEIKDILTVQTAKYGSPVIKEMGETAAWRLRKAQAKCGRFPSVKLVKALEFLTDMDYMIKSGQLDMTNEQKANYIVTNVWGILYE